MTRDKTTLRSDALTTADPRMLAKADQQESMRETNVLQCLSDSK
jgi:hypothetical protein